MGQTSADLCVAAYYLYPEGERFPHRRHISRSLDAVPLPSRRRMQALRVNVLDAQHALVRPAAVADHRSD
jgi:hypothetical protein